MTTSLLNSSVLAHCKTHKEKLLGLYELIHRNVYGYAGAQILKVPNNKDVVNIKLVFSQTDLKRFQDIQSTKSYLLNVSNKTLINLDQVPKEVPSSLLAETTDPLTGQYSVRFRKGEGESKDVFVEVWTDQGFRSSLKVTDKMTKVYNDTVFGGISWSKDSKHIVFIGEKPEVAKYKPFFKDEEEKKEEAKKEDKKEDGKEPEKEFWQDEKFLLKEHFGETLAGKQNPAVFVFDLDSNKLSELQFGKHLAATDYPQYPIFDEHSKGVIFSAVSMPIKKLGLNFCLNRPTSIYYAKDPIFKKEEVDKVEEGKYLTCLNPGEYLGM
jgi:hypothetical protein